MRIPSAAFDYYVGLGANRSYEAVAECYHVSKRAITKCAVRENWQGRLDQIEAQARRASDQKLVESLQDMNQRHLKSLRVIQGKSLEALRTMPLDSAWAAVRSLELAIRGERVIRGEPGERSAAQLKTESTLNLESLSVAQRAHLRAFLGASTGTAAPHSAANGDTANGHEEPTLGRDDVGF